MSKLERFSNETVKILDYHGCADDPPGSCGVILIVGEHHPLNMSVSEFRQLILCCAEVASDFLEYLKEKDEL